MVLWQGPRPPLPQARRVQGQGHLALPVAWQGRVVLLLFHPWGLLHPRERRQGEGPKKLHFPVPRVAIWPYAFNYVGQDQHQHLFSSTRWLGVRQHL